MSVSPELEEFVGKYDKDAARWAIGKIAKQVLGDSLGGAVSGPLLSAFGLAAVNEAAEYLKTVQKELRQVREQLVDLQRSVTEARNAITVLSNLVTEEFLMDRLSKLEQCADIIRTHFDLAMEDIASLEGVDSDQNTLHDLYERLHSPNDAAVSIAMSSMHSFLITTPANPGVLERLMTNLTSAMVKFSADKENYRHTRKVYADTTRMVPITSETLLGSMMLSGAYKQVEEQLVLAGDIFQRIVTVQMKGLIYLSLAWRGGPHKQELDHRIQEVFDVIKRMQAFPAAALETINTAVEMILLKYGPRLTLSERAFYGSGGKHHDGSLPKPLDDKWIIWGWEDKIPSVHTISKEEWDDSAKMLARMGLGGTLPVPPGFKIDMSIMEKCHVVYEPWKFGECAQWMVGNNASATYAWNREYSEHPAL